MTNELQIDSQLSQCTPDACEQIRLKVEAARSIGVPYCYHSQRISLEHTCLPPANGTGGDTSSHDHTTNIRAHIAIRSDDGAVTDREACTYSCIGADEYIAAERELFAK